MNGILQNLNWAARLLFAPADRSEHTAATATLETAPFAPSAPAMPRLPRGATVRVLHVINGEHYAGAERVQDLLALRLPEFGFEVGFACTRLKSFAEVRRAKSAPLYDLSMRGKFDLRAARNLARLVHRDGYDLIHSHTPRSALVGAWASWWTGVPMVHHLHSPAACDSTRRWNNAANVLVERVCLRRAAAIVTVSESLARYAAGAGMNRAALTTVPNGVPSPGPLAERSVPSGDWTIGSVALFRPRKGLEVLLDALAALRDAGHSIRLRAVGTFETKAYEAEIMARVERLRLGPLVDWRGFCTDVAAELRAMDLFVLPSLFGEGMPMVVLEAMAAGVPVVATRVEGVPEAIRDGVDGLIAEPGDAHSLAGTISRVVNGQVGWERLRTQSHARHAEAFSDRRMAQRVAEVYDRVLAARSKGA